MGLDSASLLAFLLQEKPAAPAPAAPIINVSGLISTVVLTLIFVLIGLVIFGLAFWLITKITPFSIRKEIEEDQNTALGVVIGAVILGLAWIIAAAIG